MKGLWCLLQLLIGTVCCKRWPLGRNVRNNGDAAWDAVMESVTCGCKGTRAEALWETWVTQVCEVNDRKDDVATGLSGLLSIPPSGRKCVRINKMLGCLKRERAQLTSHHYYLCSVFVRLDWRLCEVMKRPSKVPYYTHFWPLFYRSGLVQHYYLGIK